MSQFPDFSEFGYQALRELGNNHQAGRTTYLASDVKAGHLVVIKHFHAIKDVGGAKFQEHQQEIQVLRSLDHPGVPPYLNSFETQNGFCLVQGYKAAQPLTESRSFSLEEIKLIALEVLDILVYLQQRVPPVLHRDIKPQNILVGTKLEAYLVDFGLSPSATDDALMSDRLNMSGFTPPEQLFNRPLTEASDLYSFGATLICWLTGVPPHKMNDLLDQHYQLQFKHRLSQFSFSFVNWLETLVEPHPRDRFPNARAALTVLKSIEIIKTPEIELEPSVIYLAATRPEETLTQVVKIRNSMPDTVLEGRWEVAPHLSDPPHTPAMHSWISFSPYQFATNLVECTMTVETSRLISGATYEREIWLHTNAATQPLSLQLTVKTAPPLETGKLPRRVLLFLLLLNTLYAFAWVGMLVMDYKGHQGISWALLGTFTGMMFGAVTSIWAALWFYPSKAILERGMVGLLAGMIAGGAAGALGFVLFAPTAEAIAETAEEIAPALLAAATCVLSGIAGAIAGGIVGNVAQNLLYEGFHRSSLISIIGLTMLLGASLGGGLALGLLHPLLLVCPIVTTSLLSRQFARLVRHQINQIAERHQSEAGLIQP
jgi:serine/threonine protein kinase